MKKLFPMLAALAFVFTACTSQTASVSDSADNAPAEPTAAVEPTDDIVTEILDVDTMPVGELHSVRCGQVLVLGDDMYSIGTYLYPDKDAQRLYKTNIKTGDRKIILDQDRAEMTAQGLAWNAFLALFTTGETPFIYAHSGQDDSLTQLYWQQGDTWRDRTLATAFSPRYYDSAALYAVDSFYDRGGRIGDTLLRLDLQTWRLTRISFPDGYYGPYDAYNGEFLLKRDLYDQPLPDNNTNPDLYTALLQSARAEYAWFDPATGNLRSVFVCTDPQNIGYLGHYNDTLYFTVDEVIASTKDLTTIQTTLCKLDDTAGTLQAFENIQLINGRFMAVDRDTETVWIYGGENLVYNLTDGRIYPGTVWDKDTYIFPYRFLPDGRLVVYGNFDLYGVIQDIDAYLNGTAEPPAMLPAEPERPIPE